MPAATFDFVENHRLEQGVDFSKQFVWKNSSGVLVDLSGFSAHAQFRKNKSAKEVLIDMSTDDNSIVLGGSAGTITLVFSESMTTGAAWTSGVYDLELTDPSGKKIRFIEGAFELSQEVTRV